MNRVPPPRRLVREKKSNPFIIPILLLGGGALIAQMFWTQENQYLFQPFSIQRFECDLCDQRGVVENEVDHRLMLCPVCFGVGGKNVRRIDEGDKRCIACDGMGRILDPTPEDPLHARTCTRCDGRGLVRGDVWSGTPSDLKLVTSTNNSPAPPPPSESP